jgi:hypothetical protein
MNTPAEYEIRIRGRLPEDWIAWFEGLACEVQPCGETTLRGVLPDQAALMGVLTRIHTLNIILLSVQRVAP